MPIAGGRLSLCQMQVRRSQASHECTGSLTFTAALYLSDLHGECPGSEHRPCRLPSLQLLRECWACWPSCHSATLCQHQQCCRPILLGCSHVARCMCKYTASWPCGAADPGRDGAQRQAADGTGRRGTPAAGGRTRGALAGPARRLNRIRAWTPSSTPPTAACAATAPAAAGASSASPTRSRPSATCAGARRGR